MGFGIDWQTFLATAIVLAATGYLVARLRRFVRTGRSAGCTTCGGCGPTKLGSPLLGIRFSEKKQPPRGQDAGAEGGVQK